MIGQKASLMLANMVFGTVLGLVAAILVGRNFEASQVGQLGGAISVVGLFFFITDLGMGHAHVKRVSEGRDPGDCFATYAVFKLVATAVFVLLVGGAVFVYHGVLGKPLIDTTLPILLIVIGYYVARSLAEVGQSSFDARLETAKSSLAQLTDTVLRVGLTILFALAMAALVHSTGPLVGRVDALSWVAENPGLSLAIATAAGALGALVVSMTLLFRTLEWGRFRWEVIRDYASFALPLFVANAITLISTYIDGTVLIVFRDSVDTGIFTEVRRLPLVLTGIGTALSALLFPTVSALLARGDHAGVQAKAEAALRYLSMLLVPAAAFTIAFPQDVIRLTIGEKWLAGAPLLALLAIYVLFSAFGQLHSFLLLGHGRSDVTAKVGILTAVTLIVLNLLLVPDDIQSLGIELAGLGLTGVGIATVASGAVWYASMRYASYRFAGFRERNHTLRHILAGAIMAGGLLALDATVFPLVRYYHFLAYVLIGGVLYLGALIALRAVSRADYDYARARIHPIEMLRYIRGEIRRKRE